MQDAAQGADVVGHWRHSRRVRHCSAWSRAAPGPALARRGRRLGIMRDHPPPATTGAPMTTHAHPAPPDPPQPPGRGHRCGCDDHRHRGPGLPRRLGWRRGVLPRPTATRRCSRRCMRADRPAGLCTHQLLHERGGRGTGGHPGRERPGGNQPRLLCLRGVRGGRGGAKDGPPVHGGDRPAATRTFHRPAPELPRQHPRRAGGRRQCVAAAPVRTAADPGDPRVTVLRVPRPRRWRNGPAVRPAPGAGAGSGDRPSSAATR